ncbi:hypothetical protein M405DRAFT_834432, partial [Rhizopogon salebrosus TDB-379]
LQWDSTASRKHCAHHGLRLFVCITDNNMKGSPRFLEERLAIDTRRKTTSTAREESCLIVLKSPLACGSW